ncbi:hypothetical protein KKD19_00130 [Patescibacteria group bacterium]|nr:hypothetical protein [Patescibacteria group bacterium]MBU4511645.1 hypothetical protein [Patescibacteria group bacterium]MCG2692715.1 hypothetical protein [Candidatus Parcubacteria bacterium]
MHIEVRKKAINFLKIRRPWLATVVFFSVFCLALLISQPAFAFNLPWESQILGFFGTILLFLIGLLGKLLMVVIDILIKIAAYGDFVNSGAVAKGWVVLRDVCNMFFIVILLVTAFSTVLSIERYSYKRLLPMLLIMAVLINFSKTIAGVFIDMAQVVMMTFVNGFKYAAAGNLTTAFGLQGLLKYKDNVEDVDLSGTLASLVLALIMLLIAVIVTAVIAAVLIIRIIALWILVVVSPIAYLAAAAPGGQKYSGMWWSNFTKYVTIGPILAFFLWLSFAIMGDSNDIDTIKTKYGGGKDAKGNETSISAAASEASSSENMLGFAIAIAMLMGSLMAAQQLGGVAGSMAGKWQGKISGAGKAALGGFGAARYAKRKAWEGTKAVAGSGWKATNIPAAASALKEWGLGKVKMDTKSREKRAKADELRRAKWQQRVGVDTHAVARVKARQIEEGADEKKKAGVNTLSSVDKELKKATGIDREMLIVLKAKLQGFKDEREIEEAVGGDKVLDALVRAQLKDEDLKRPQYDEDDNYINKHEKVREDMKGKSQTDVARIVSKVTKGVMVDSEGHIGSSYIANQLQGMTDDQYDRLDAQSQEDVLKSLAFLATNKKAQEAHDVSGDEMKKMYEKRLHQSQTVTDRDGRIKFDRFGVEMQRVTNGEDLGVSVLGSEIEKEQEERNRKDIVKKQARERKEAVKVAGESGRTVNIRQEERKMSDMDKAMMRIADKAGADKGKIFEELAEAVSRDDIDIKEVEKKLEEAERILLKNANGEEGSAGVLDENGKALSERNLVDRHINQVRKIIGKTKKSAEEGKTKGEEEIEKEIKELEGELEEVKLYSDYGTTGSDSTKKAIELEANIKEKKQAAVSIGQTSARERGIPIKEETKRAVQNFSKIYSSKQERIADLEQGIYDRSIRPEIEEGLSGVRTNMESLGKKVMSTQERTEVIKKERLALDNIVSKLSTTNFDFGIPTRYPELLDKNRKLGKAMKGLMEKFDRVTLGEILERIKEFENDVASGSYNDYERLGTLESPLEEIKRTFKKKNTN